MRSECPHSLNVTIGEINNLRKSNKLLQNIFTGVKVSLPVDPQEKPRLIKAHTIPSSLKKDKVETKVANLKS